MAAPLIVIVDENDTPIGAASSKEARRQGLYHRIVYVMVENLSGSKVLLQKRSQNMSTYPGCWDVAVGGHVDQGEDYLQAARRELMEELGIKDMTLKEIGTYKSETMLGSDQLNRFNRVYQLAIPEDTALKVQAEEIVATDWVEIGELKDRIRLQPVDYALGIAQVLKRFY